MDCVWLRETRARPFLASIIFHKFRESCFFLFSVADFNFRGGGGGEDIGDFGRGNAARQWPPTKTRDKSWGLRGFKLGRALAPKAGVTLTFGAWEGESEGVGKMVAR